MALALALAASAQTAAAADVSWTVTEGAGGATRGVWHLRMQGNRVSGSAEMVTANGRKLTYQLNGEMQSGEFKLQRGNPSDGTPCAYRGKPDATGRLTGAALCGTGASTWSAVKK